MITSQNYKNHINFICLLEKDNVPFYVGRTIDFEKRMSIHKKTFGDFKSTILINCYPEYADFYERKCISHFISLGINLKNRLLYREKEKSTFLFTFKNKRVRKAARLLAFENDISLQKLLDEALKLKHPDLFNDK